MADAKDPKDPHTLTDHKLGADLAHIHDGDADHDHDDFFDGPIEDNPLWLQDHVSLTSVGIDIGSAGTQVIFSRVELRRMGEDLSSRYFVVNRETLYRSPVALTPYQSEERIDDADFLLRGEPSCGAGHLCDHRVALLRGRDGDRRARGHQGEVRGA